MNIWRLSIRKQFQLAYYRLPEIYTPLALRFTGIVQVPSGVAVTDTEQYPDLVTAVAQASAAVVEAETALSNANTATSNANSAASAASVIATTLQNKLNNGDFVGAKGDKGDTGATGPAGPQGPKGDPGIQGVQGEKGDKGDPGPTGSTGATGPQGPRGIQGERGADGVQGIAGTSAYAAAVSGGFVGTESDFNNIMSGLSLNVFTLDAVTYNYHFSVDANGELSFVYEEAT